MSESTESGQQIQLDDWQEEVLNHNGNLLLCTGRQVGKTTTMAAKAAEYMLNHPNSQIIVVSLTEDQAQLMIVMVLSYLEGKSRKMIARGKGKPTKNTVTLTNGSKIIARPVGNTGDAVRGFTGPVLIVDEASRMPEMMWAAAKPVLLTFGGQIWMCSTPHGKQGYFYECYLNKHGRYKVVHISSEEVIHNRPIRGLWTEQRAKDAKEFLEQEKKDLSELRYGQEYLGKFLDDLRQFFPDALIEKSCKRKRPEVRSSKGIYLMGCDLARLGGDHTAIEILEKMPSGLTVQVENVLKKGLYTNESEDLIKMMAEQWNIAKIGLDAGAGTLGVSIFDHLYQNRSIRRKLVAMNNRTIPVDKEGKKLQRIFKEDMYDNLLAMMLRGEIELLDDAEIIIGLKSIQWEMVREKDQQSRVKIYANPHDAGDCVEGLIRAAWLSKEKNLNLWISYI